jgi:threonine dehydrogenase-like Zn-dependent dehydrogenase
MDQPETGGEVQGQSRRGHRLHSLLGRARSHACHVQVRSCGVRVEKTAEPKILQPVDAIVEDTTVTVTGDGVIGLLAVLSAKLLGAPRNILMGHHQARTDLGVELGTSDVVAERAEEGATDVKDLTNSDGNHVVIEAVGYQDAYDQAFGVVRKGGTVSWVGLAQYQDANVRFASM